jgi:protease-4
MPVMRCFRWWHVVGVLLWFLPGCVFLTGNFNPFSSAPQGLEEHVVSGEGGAKVLLIDISRVIGSQEEEGTFGIKRRDSTTARVQEELQKAAQDDRVRAVVLRINSPGGSVTASDVLYHQLMEFKQQRHVPLVAQLLDMATSGGYYVALAADEIVASPTTVTGSVGVVMYGLNLTGLLEKLGVKDQTLKAGQRKDMGSPLRQMTREEAQILQSILAQMHERFLSIVRERRPAMTPETLQTIADGRVLTADQALQAQLVDRIGYLQDTIDATTRRAGLTQARVVLYRRPDEFAENIYSRAPVGPAQVNLVNIDLGGLGSVMPQFMYLWPPAMWLPGIE